ncbi:DUF4328 domain-containing protein [Aldersonia sp. NBC_00410]|uniref:DUF4328 domain-containing protein n=1 Tax=Aldersonia sp. NBC_00410 TaxID=2975954 RepID=UPI00224E97D8|nr:DUF4328 domain-containing protein [Aldersonia sp. NBC_00410]MCX5045129.1 DUF4328 domain-containing protein [Aldersonia sp. NBC_00410]
MRPGMPISGGPPVPISGGPPVPVQVCARCAAQWPVRGRPIQWCPRCHGVLLAPARPDAPLRARNYRWVARRPGPPRRTAPTSAPTPTPRYPETPRWGLIDTPPMPQAAPRTPLAWFADRVEALLIVTAMLFVLAALAEGLRYAILLRNRAHLIEQWLLSCSDAAVWSTSVLALLVALVAALAVVGWLIRARAEEFADRGRLDPRATPFLVAGCVVPVLNLIAPGVFLTELAQRRPREQLIAVRVWWCTWVLGAVMAIAALAWRSAGSLQAQADGVVFTALTDVVAATVAVVTLGTIYRLEDRDLRGRPRRAKRWLMATGPHRPIIEPIRGVVDHADTEREDSDAQVEVAAT